ncbi:retrotransposable element Tf2 [Tanacetum coccineum]|uniref:Retrotransposable element Tf2 n=1 Tax=Tanacetum coccineum TaxID=301880 RepID=A0ABQ4ZF15_9ASTR
MQKWPTPANVKQLRGFLGLTGYYMRFIRNYAIISKPLTTLLKKNSFAWNPSAQATFEELKLAMIQAPVLALADFYQPFIVETDASGMGIRAVLQQCYDYEISYKKGSENTAANALSKISSGSELCSLILSTIEDNTNTGTKYTWTNRELRRKGKLVVGSDEQLRKTLSDLAASPGLLQPLPIPTKVWDNISTDFIEALPLSQGKTVLFVVVDRLSKYAYFIPMSHPFTANQVAQVFMDDIYKLHGHECAIESIYCLSSLNGRLDRDSQQIYGVFHEFHLKRSQERIKNMADKNRSDISFEVGMKVCLKLQPYRQVTVRQGTHHKFAAKFYESFLIFAKIRKVAYKLQLLENSQIHPVFHVSQLKLCKGTNHQVGILPQCGPDEVLSVEPEAIIAKRLGKLHNKAVLYVLVKWVN